VTGFVDGVCAWKKKPYRWRLPGLYTDDTQQALVLADVLLERGRMDAEHVAELYLRLATPKGSYLGAHRGTGRSFKQVLTDLENGIPADRTGQTSAGIGAAMRIAPLALYYSSHPEAMFEAVMAASLITHRDIRSLAGAMAVAIAVRSLLVLPMPKEPKSKEEEKIPPSFLFRLAAEVNRAEDQIAARYPNWVVGLDDYLHSVSTAIAHVEACLSAPRDRALATLVEEANRHGADPACKRPTMGFPPACIPTCLYVLLSTDSFDEAVADVVNLGGDADTTGAILGAMAGAFYGLEELPKRWLAGLENRHGIDMRAQALLQRSAEGFVIPDIVETERRLSDRESECRDRLLGIQRSGGGGGGGDCGANQRL
jgi:ADP-ribosylglycohydrolase